MPSTIVNSDNVRTVGGRSGRVIDYNQDGTLWVVMHDGSSGDAKFFYSKDAGVNWSESSGSRINEMLSGFTYPFFHSIAFFIDKDDFAHCVYNTDVGADPFRYRRGTPNSTRTEWTWSDPINLEPAGTGGRSVLVGLDVVAHREGTGWRAHVVDAGYQITSTIRIYHWVINITTAGVLSIGDENEVSNTGTSIDTVTSLDFRHTEADPKDVQSSTPNLYLAAGQTVGGFGGMQFWKATYSAGAWTWGSLRNIDGGDLDRLSDFNLMYDGTRVVMVHGAAADAAVTAKVNERDEADTATTPRTPTALADGSILQLACSYGRNADIWLMAQADASDDFKKIRYNRVANTWGSWTVVEADTTSDSNSRLSLMRGMDQALCPFIGATYCLNGPSPDQSKFDILVASWLGDSTLRGVGSLTGEGSLGIIGSGQLQGVGSFGGVAALGLAGVATLQGVGNLTPTPLFLPKKDFTVYDGYVDSPASGTIPLIYFEDDSARPQTTSRPLRPPRTDTGVDSTELRPESGEIFSQQDFSHGAGQLYYHHEGRDVRRFLWSEGFEVHIDTVGQPTLLHHLNDVPSAAMSSATVGKIEVFNDSPFVIDGANIKKGSGDFPGFWTSENPGGTPQDVTSSGEFLYAALGANGIARRTTGGTWSIWQTTPLATRIAWVKNRIMASDGAVTYEITDVVREVERLPVGWVFEAIFEAGGFIYAVANNASSGLSRISTYGLNQDGDAIEKKNETPFPRNQLMYSGRGFLGSVYIGGGIKNSDEGFDPVVYQAFPQDSGALTYLKVNEGEGAGSIDLSVKAFEPIGEDIVFGWSLGSGFDFGARDGLAIHKPKVDAFLSYLKKSGAGAGRQVLGIALYRGRLLFSLKGDGLYYEDTSHFVAQAQLWTSVADWQTTAKKSWDLIQVSHNRLPAQTSVRAEYSTRLPSEGAWNPGVFSDVDDSEVAEARFTDVTSQMLSIRLTSLANSAQTLAPSGHGFLVRSNVLPDHPEFGLTRYVRLVNKDRKDNDAPMVFNDVAAVRRKLHNLSYQWVTLYEPGVIWTLHVDSVSEVQPFLVEYDATLGEGQAQGYVIQLTMTGTRD